MATRYIVLPLHQPILPDASGSNNDPPDIQLKVSTGSQTANTPKVTHVEWLFDDTTDQHLLWSFQLPGDYNGGAVLRATWRSDTTSSGSARWKGGQATSVPGTTNETTLVFTIAGSVSAVSSTTSSSVQYALTLDTDNMAANRRTCVYFGRDANNANDTLGGDAILQSLVFEYETSS